MPSPWTTQNIPDLTGKVIIVTGGNSGIGYEAAKEFARKGAKTILACRNMEKASTAKDQILAEMPAADIEIMLLDLASLASVRQFASDFSANYDWLDILLNNAGIMMVPYGLTKDGFERQFGTNHLGHFALTGLLINLLLNTPDSRIVNISSNAHKTGVMDFDNLMFAKGEGYKRMAAYGRSKLANILFTYELQRRFDAMGAKVLATAAHPGISDTNLAGHITNRWYIKWLMPFFSGMLQSAAMGALPSLRAAVDPEAAGGAYYGPDGKDEREGYPVVVEAVRAAHNKEDARRLWEISEQLTGVKYFDQSAS